MTALIYLLGFISGAAAAFLLRIIFDARKRPVGVDLSNEFDALLRY